MNEEDISIEKSAGEIKNNKELENNINRGYPVKWDPAPKNIHCTHTQLMKVACAMFFLSGGFAFADGLYGLYSINNPNKYAFNLKDYHNIPETRNKALNFDVTLYDNINISIFLNDFLTNTSMNENRINDYVAYNYKNGGVKSRRYFIHLIIFGVFQILTSILSFNLRYSHTNWKYDLCFAAFFEAFGNMASLANVVIWLLIEFGGDFSYFIYFAGHEIVHYSSFCLSILTVILKLYFFSLTFNDYWGGLANMKKQKKNNGQILEKNKAN